MGGGSIRVGSDDIEWPWKAVREGLIFFRRISLIILTLVPLDLERPISAGTRRGRAGRISRWSSTHHKSAWPQHSLFFWGGGRFLLFMHTPFDAELPNLACFICCVLWALVAWNKVFIHSCMGGGLFLGVSRGVPALPNFGVPFYLIIHPLIRRTTEFDVVRCNTYGEGDCF